MSNLISIIRPLWKAAFLVSCTACSGEGTDVVLVEELAGDRANQAPQSFIDESGREWIRTGDKPVEYSDEDPTLPSGENPGVPLLEMSEEDAIEALRPVRLVGDYEYTLEPGAAREFGLEILELARDKEDMGDEAGSGPFNSEGEPLETMPDLEPKSGVFPPDNRENIDWAKGIWPQITTARMTYWQATSYISCSAFKIGEHGTAATAGHCVHSGSYWLLKKEIQFGNQPVMPGNCYEITVPGCWDGDDMSCDYAALNFNRNTAWCDPAGWNVGYLGYNTPGSSVDGIKAYANGYPGTPPNMWPYKTLVQHYHEGGWTSTFYPAEVFFYNDISGGQSGAPYFSYYTNTADFRARGITTYMDQGLFYDTNVARKMTKTLHDWLKANGGNN